MGPAAVRAGDALVVPKPARSVPDARDIGDSLTVRNVKLSLGSAICDPTDPMGKMFVNILATFAEFEVDLLRMRTRDGMAVARSKGKLRGKQPELSARQSHLVEQHATGEHTIADLAELLSVSRATVHQVLERGKLGTLTDPAKVRNYLTDRSRYAYGLRRGQDQGIRSGRRAAVGP